MIATQDKKELAAQIALAIYDAIMEFGRDGVPSGHLYAVLMGKMSLDIYEVLIGALKSTKLITEDGFHVLRATIHTR